MDAEMNKANVKNCHQLHAAGTFISLCRQPLKNNAYGFFFSSQIIFLLIKQIDVFRTREIRWFLLEWVTF